MKKLSIVIATLLLSMLPFIGVSSMPDIKEARKYAEEKLLPIEGIAGISHTEKPPKIIVYIEHEKHKDKVPSEIKGFKTEVIVTGRIKALEAVPETESTVTTYNSQVSRTGTVRPIVGGISIGVPEKAFGGKMAGTLGIVTNDSNNQPCILTNAHVIAMDKNAKFLPIGTSVLQPGTYDGGTNNDKVGELYKYIKITFNSYLAKNYADAAIAKVTTDQYSIGKVLDTDNQNTYEVKGSTTVNQSDIVRKSGRTTGVTNNTVNATSATVRVWYTQSKWAIFYDQILVNNQPFIQSGDSGSLVDKDGKFVGLAFAGSDTIAVVCKAKYIISGLGISI